MFIKVTENSNNTNIYYLHIDKINYFTPKTIIKEGKSETFTLIILESSTWFSVKETPEEILNLIKEEKNV